MHDKNKHKILVFDTLVSEEVPHLKAEVLDIKRIETIAVKMKWSEGERTFIMTQEEFGKTAWVYEEEKAN